MSKQVSLYRMVFFQLIPGIIIWGLACCSLVSASPSVEDGQIPLGVDDGQLSCMNYAVKAIAQAETLRKAFHLSRDKACMPEKSERWEWLHDEYKEWCEAGSGNPKKVNTDLANRAKILLNCFNTIYLEAPADLTPEYVQAHYHQLGAAANKAAEKNNIVQLKGVYAYGAPLDWHDFSINRESAIDIAAGYLHIEASEFLLSIGSSAESVNEEGISSIEMILRANGDERPGKYAVLQLFLSHGADPNYLSFVIDRVSDLKAGEILLKSGANPQAAPSGTKMYWGGGLPLYTVASRQDYPFARLLLLYGANPYFDPAHFHMSGVNGQLSSPLVAAVRANDYKMVELFLKDNARLGSVYIRDKVFPAAVSVAAGEHCGTPEYKKPGTILYLLLQNGGVLDEEQDRECLYSGENVEPVASTIPLSP